MGILAKIGTKARLRRSGLLFSISMCAACLPFQQVSSQVPKTIVEDLGYPEGPLWMGDKLYVAEMWADRLITWEQGEMSPFWYRQGCGPTSVAQFDTSRLAILCHISDEVIILDPESDEESVITLSQFGPSVFNPNDITPDGRGGVYFTASGDFDLSAPIEGHVLHMNVDEEINVVAKGVHYANGITRSPDGTHLLVSEHFGHRVLTWPIQSEGALGEVATHLDVSGLDVETDPYYDKWGPDGLEFGPDGNLYLAIYGKGVVLVFDTQGKQVDQIGTDLQLLTNVAFDDSGHQLFLTGTKYSRLGAGRGALLLHATMGN